MVQGSLGRSIRLLPELAPNLIRPVLLGLGDAYGFELHQLPSLGAAGEAAREYAARPVHEN